MENRYQKFTESKQEALRLAIALEDYFLTENEVHKAAYENYLLRRLRPAAAALVQTEATDKLEHLFTLSPFSSSLMDELVCLAAREQRSSSLVWLLQKKQTAYGFTPRVFTL